MREDLKPYNDKILSFLIKTLGLQPNKYTRNDFLYIRKYKELTIAYNPRYQLLDFHPTRDGYHSRGFSLYECNLMLEISQKIFNKIDFDFFMQTGNSLNSFIYSRLYGVQCEYGSFDFITPLTDNKYREWSEVEDWHSKYQIYLKNKYFKYASIYPYTGYDGKMQVNPNYSKKETKLETKEMHKQHRLKPRFFLYEKFKLNLSTDPYFRF